MRFGRRGTAGLVALQETTLFFEPYLANGQLGMAVAELQKPECHYCSGGVGCFWVLVNVSVVPVPAKVGRWLFF